MEAVSQSKEDLQGASKNVSQGPSKEGVAQGQSKEMAASDSQDPEQNVDQSEDEGRIHDTEEEDFHEEEKTSVFQIPLDVPEYAEVMAERKELAFVVKTKFPNLPDIEELKFEVDQEMKYNFKRMVAENAVLRLYDLLVKYRATLVKMATTLDKREDELNKVIDMSKNDSRVLKMVSLAEGWRKEMCTKEEEASELRDQLDDMLDERTLLRQSITAMQTTITRLSKELEANESKNDAGLNSVTEQLYKKINEIEKLTTDKDSLKSSMIEMKEKNTKLTKMGVDCAEMQTKLYTIETQMTRISNEKDAVIIEKDNLTKRLYTHLQRDVENFKRIGYLRKQVNDVSEKFDALKQCSRILDTQNRKLTFQYNSISKERTDLAFQLSETKNKAESLEVVIKEQEKNLKHAAETINEANNNVFKKQQFIEKVMAKLATCTSENKNTAFESAIIKKEIEVLQKEFSAQTVKLDKSLVNNRKTEKKLQTEKTNVNAMMQRTDMLLKNLDEASSAIVKFRHSNEALHTANSQLATKITHIKERSEEQARHIDKQNDKIDTLIQQSILLDKAMSMSHELIQAYKRKNQCLATETFTMIEETRQLQIKLHLTIQETNSAFHAIAERDREIMEFQSSQAKMRTELGQMNTINNQMRDKMNTALEELHLERELVKAHINDLVEANNQLNKAAFKEKLVIQQRDIFAARVVQANVERDLQILKLERQHEVIQAGNIELHQARNDLDILKKEIKHLRFKLKTVSQVKNINVILRGDLIKTEKELLLEKNKNAALENMIPTRVHLNRELMALNPSSYELVMKSQRLVRCLIKKTDQVVALESSVLVLKKDIMTMKMLVAARSAPNLPSELSALRSDARSKDRKIKALVAEMSMLKEELSLREKYHVSAVTGKPDGLTLVDGYPRTSKLSKHVSLPEIQPQKGWRKHNTRRLGGGYRISNPPPQGARHKQSALPDKKNVSYVPRENRNYNAHNANLLPGKNDQNINSSSVNKENLSTPPPKANLKDNEGPEDTEIPPIDFDFDDNLNSDLDSDSFSEHESDEEQLSEILAAARSDRQSVYSDSDTDEAAQDDEPLGKEHRNSSESVEESLSDSRSSVV